MSIVEYNPDKWLTSLHRSLKSYIESKIDSYIEDSNDDPAGLQAYDVIMDWPEADDPAQPIQLQKTLIHFVVDDIDSQSLGIGTNVVNSTEALQIAPLPDLVRPEQAMMHTVNYDVGVWTSDKTGGASARLEVREMLNNIFGGDYARRQLHAATEGIEIRSFSGGAFITEKVNDVRVFRLIDCTLVVRVFSRFRLDDEVITEDVVQDPDLEIDNLPVE